MESRNNSRVKFSQKKKKKRFVRTSLDFSRLTVLERPLQSFTSGEEIKIGTKSDMDRPHKYLQLQLGDHIYIYIDDIKHD